MARMNELTRKRVIDTAQKAGFRVELKANKQDNYVKTLMFYGPAIGQYVYVRKDSSFNSAGDANYFKVVVHPDYFRSEFAKSSQYVEVLENRRTGDSLTASSNYQQFPHFDGYKEPCGRAYKVVNHQGLEYLFKRLAGGSKSEETPPIKPMKKKPSASNPTNDKTSGQNIKPASRSLFSRLFGGSKAKDTSDTISKNEEKTIDSVQQFKKVTHSTQGSDLSGLIIREEPIGKILAGEKIWEMRPKDVKKRGPIALIKKGSGQVVGIADLVNVIGPLTDDDMLDNIDKHQINIDRLYTSEVAKWRTAWVLDNVRPLRNPVSYKHPSGAVTWVTLSSDVCSKVWAQAD